jgi:tetratricopeptide (TPR) repeat protein
MKKLTLSFSVLILVVMLSADSFSQRKSLSIFPETNQSQVVEKARKKLNTNDVDGALKILDEAIVKKLDLFEVYHERYIIRRFYLFDNEGAIVELENALKIKPDDVSSYLSLGSLKQSKQDFVGALKIYETAQNYVSDSAEIHLQKAHIKSNLKDFDGAMTEIQSAVKLKPESIYLQIKISDLLFANKKSEQAISNLQNFLDGYIKKYNGELPKLKGEKIKKNKIVHNPDGSTSGKARRYSQMEFSASSPEDLRKQQDKIEEVRNLAKAYIALGKLYIAQNNFEKAFTNFDTALLIDKNQEEAYAMRGVIYLSKGEIEKAIVELSYAADIADEPYFYLNRGIAYLLIKNDKNAQNDFDYFLKLYPDGKPILDQRLAEARNQIK